MKKIVLTSLLFALPLSAFAEHQYQVGAKMFRYDDSELLWHYGAKKWHKDFTTGKMTLSYGATDWDLDTNGTSSFSRGALKVKKSPEKIELQHGALHFVEENGVIYYEKGATKLTIDKDKISFQRGATKKEIDGKNWKYERGATRYQN